MPAQTEQKPMPSPRPSPLRQSLESKSKGQSKLLTMGEVKVEVQRLLVDAPTYTSVEFLEWAEQDLGTPAVLKKLPTTKLGLLNYVSKFKIQRTNSAACSSTSKSLPELTKPGCSEPPSTKPVKVPVSETATGQPVAIPCAQAPQQPVPPACRSAPAGPAPKSASAEAASTAVQAKTLPVTTAKPATIAPAAEAQNLSEPEAEILRGWEPADDWCNFIAKVFNKNKLSDAVVAKLKNTIITDDINQPGKSYVDGGLEHWFHYHYTQLDEYKTDRKVCFIHKHTC